MSDRGGPARPATLSGRWARRVLRLYPRAWRERYGAEVSALLGQHRASPWTVLDVALGAVDAHLHRDLLPGRIVSMAHHLRTSELAIFCAYILFFVPWLALQRVPDPTPGWRADVARHPELALAFNAMEVAGAVALLAIVAGGVPLLVAALRQAVIGRRRDVLRPLTAAVVLVMLYVALSVATYLEISSRPGTGVRPLRPFDTVLSLIWLAASLVGAVVGPYLVATAIARSDLGAGILRLALIPAAVATVALAAGVGAAVALTALSAQRSPDLYDPIISPIVMAMMVAAAALAFFALWRGLTTRPDAAAPAA